jgi:phosphatidate cytidylyltransferase
MLRWRLILGTLIIAALVGLCWFDHLSKVPGVWLLPVAIVAVVLGTKEVLDMAALAGLRPLRWAVYLGNVLLVCSNWAAVLQWSHRLPFGWQMNGMLYGTTCLWTLATLSALGAGVILLFLGEMARYRQPGGNTANLAAGVLGLIYVGVLMSFAVQLRFFWGIAGIAAWVIVVKMGDTGAYTVGRLIGRHKMAPAISPGKTIEGAFGALAFSCFGAWASFRWLVPALMPESAATGLSWGWILFGLLVGLAGMLGDLAESMLKRDVGVKDSSTWMPGFGGVLDILDSLLLSAPVAWFCWASGIVGR